jgi:hypothetical protein
MRAQSSNFMRPRHDVLDWFAAIGPTAATFFTAWIAWKVYRNGERLQRQLMRPIVAFQSQWVQPFCRWIVEMENIGQSAANLESFRVYVNGERIQPEQFEQPRPYWARVMMSAGSLGIQDVDGNLISAPRAIKANEKLPLFDVTIRDDAAKCRISRIGTG